MDVNTARLSRKTEVFRDVYEQVDPPTEEWFHSLHCDFKAIAITTGIDPAPSIHPRPFCEVELHTTVKLETQLKSGTERTCQSRSESPGVGLETRGQGLQELLPRAVGFFPFRVSIRTFVRLPEPRLYLHFNGFIDWIEKLGP